MKSRPSASERFDRLIRPHISALYRFAWHLTRSVEDAEDLVQDVVVKLYPQLARMEALDEPLVWMRRVVYNHFVDTKRRQPPTESLDDSYIGEGDINDLEPSYRADEPEVNALNKETQQRIHHALAQLDPEARALIGLHVMEGRSLNELTEVFNVPLGTLKSRLHRTRSRLKQALKVDPFGGPTRVSNER